MEELLIALLEVGAELMDVVNLEPSTARFAKLVESLDRIHFLGNEDIRIKVISMWGKAAVLFRTRIASAMLDPNLQIQLAGIRACTPPLEFRRELAAIFAAGEDEVRKAVVRQWGLDPTFFDAELRVAADDTFLIRSVLEVWAHNPVQFGGNLLEVYRRKRATYSDKFMIIGLWATEPVVFRQSLFETYVSEQDDRLRSLISGIWLNDPKEFGTEIHEAMKLRKP